MSRNPYAKSLRVKPQQVISGKRESERLHALHDDALDEPIPQEWKALLARLK